MKITSLHTCGGFSFGRFHGRERATSPSVSQQSQRRERNRIGPEMSHFEPVFGYKGVGGRGSVDR